ncbi:helix-turn-helix transcriptional regulator [Marinicrinis sediminis]|uniref:Helix-turn-helix transcriptional regulator n=1 Tax=Marinicrinis sediminis TaxID=1652465 RepID=A0ABW5R9P4_9BACL
MSSERETSTRNQILTLLKMNGSSSIHLLATQLHITEMAVRRHVQALERDGLVESSLVRQAMGRPSYAYSLSRKADNYFPKSYHKLALDLLEELASDGDDLVQHLFERRQQKLERKHEERMTGKSLHERVQELVEIQNEGGYMAQLEQDTDQAYVLHEYNCPITQVAEQHEQACHCELELFKTLLQTDEVERTECLSKGGSRCSYVIRDSYKEGKTS